MELRFVKSVGNPGYNPYDSVCGFPAEKPVRVNIFNRPVVKPAYNPGYDPYNSVCGRYYGAN